MTKNEALAQYKASLLMSRQQLSQVETNLTRLEVARGDEEVSPSPSRRLLKDIRICSRALEGHAELLEDEVSELRLELRARVRE